MKILLENEVVEVSAGLGVITLRGLGRQFSSNLPGLTRS